VTHPAANEELWLTVVGRDLHEAERHAEAKAALLLRADPGELRVIAVHQLANRRAERS
jgi:hypothetical protein